MRFANIETFGLVNMAKTSGRGPYDSVFRFRILSYISIHTSARLVYRQIILVAAAVLSDVQRLCPWPEGSLLYFVIAEKRYAYDIEYASGPP